MPRNDLYSYGFKEGQAWAEGRRTLESAFRELEREIWQPPSYGWSPLSPAAHAWYHPASSRDGNFSRYPPYIRMNPSNDSEPYSYSESSSRSLPPRSGRANGRSPRFGGRRAPHRRPGEDIPSTPFRPSFMPDPGTEGPPDRIFAPPQRSSITSYRSIEDSPEFPESQSHPASSNQGSTDVACQPAEFPGHMELVSYDHGAEREELPYSQSRDELQVPLIPSSNALSQGWSVTGTRGTSDSDSSSYSRGHHFDDSAPLGYSGVPASSSYVESYDATSYDNYYPDDSDEDHGYTSDGVASDEGIYYSSSEDAEDDGSGYDTLSDEGYYSEDPDGSYDDDNNYD